MRVTGGGGGESDRGIHQRRSHNTVKHLKMEHFAKIINGFQPFTIFAKRSILDVWQGSEHASAHYRKLNEF